MATISLPKKKHRLIDELIRLILPLLILCAGFALFWISGSFRTTAKVPPPKNGVPRVETAVVQAHSGDMEIVVDGSVVPFREIELTSEVAGRVQWRHPLSRAGRFVTSGTVLLEIDPRDYELEKRRLEHELQQAEIKVEEIDVQLENARSLVELAEEELQLQASEVGRLSSLRGDRAVAASELDRARSAEILARNALQQLRNQIRVLSAQRTSTLASIDLVKTRLDQADLNLERTQIVAPVDGVIVRDLVEENSFVQRGTPVMVLEDTSAVEVRCNLMADEVAWLGKSIVERPDAELGGLYEPPQVPSTVTYERAGQQFAWQGILSRFEGIGLDERTRMYACRVLVEQPRETWRWVDGELEALPPRHNAPPLVRGMFVQVHLRIPTDVPLVRVPLVGVQLGDVVWRVRAGELEVLPISIARRLRNDAIINAAQEGALRPGDRIVVSPLSAVRSGMAVVDISSSAREGLSTEQAESMDPTDETQPHAAGPITMPTGETSPGSSLVFEGNLR